MIVIETCPKCGHDLIDSVICTYPPIPRKECPNCGWFWEGEREEVVRAPFGESGYATTTSTTSTTIQWRNYSILNSPIPEDSIIDNFMQSACVNCSNNPKNGGSGICNCTLGVVHIT